MLALSDEKISELMWAGRLESCRYDRHLQHALWRVAIAPCAALAQGARLLFHSVVGISGRSRRGHYVYRVAITALGCARAAWSLETRRAVLPRGVRGGQLAMPDRHPRLLAFGLKGRAMGGALSSAPLSR